LPHLLQNIKATKNTPRCYRTAPAHLQPPCGEPTAAEGNPSHELPTASWETRSHFSFAQLTQFVPHRIRTKLLFYLLPHESFHPARLTGPNWRCNTNFSGTRGLQ